MHLGDRKSLFVALDSGNLYRSQAPSLEALAESSLSLAFCKVFSSSFFPPFMFFINIYSS